MEVTMDSIQETLELRQRELRDSLKNTDDSLRQLEILAEILNLDERLARLG
jgi:hypothetical protein